MERNLEDKTNLEAHVWLLTSSFKICRDRTLKNTNYGQQNSAITTEEEQRSFANCVTKHLKSVALFPSIIN